MNFIWLIYKLIMICRLHEQQIFKKVVVLLRALFILNQKAERDIGIIMDQSNHFLVLRPKKLRTAAVFVLNLQKC